MIKFKHFAVITWITIPVLGALPSLSFAMPSTVTCEGKSGLAGDGETAVTVKASFFEPAFFDIADRTVTLVVSDASGTPLLTRKLRDVAQSRAERTGTGLLTAPGFSLRYNDFFGQVTEVLLIVDTRGSEKYPGAIETLAIPVCQSGF